MKSSYSRLTVKKTLLLSPPFLLRHARRGAVQVQSEVRRKWRRWMLQRFLSTADTKYQPPSMGSNGNNFSTQITMLTKCSPTTRRSSSCQEHLSAL